MTITPPTPPKKNKTKNNGRRKGITQLFDSFKFVQILFFLRLNTLQLVKQGERADWMMWRKSLPRLNFPCLSKVDDFAGV